MSAGRNKNSKTRDRKKKQKGAAFRKHIRRMSLKEKRKARRVKSRMYRLKNRLNDFGGIERGIKEIQVKKMKTQVWNLNAKAKKITSQQ